MIGTDYERRHRRPSSPVAEGLRRLHSAALAAALTVAAPKGSALRHAPIDRWSLAEYLATGQPQVVALPNWQAWHLHYFGLAMKSDEGSLSEDAAVFLSFEPDGPSIL